MAYSLIWAKAARETYDELNAAALKQQTAAKKSGKGKSSRQIGTFKQVAKTLKLLSENPKHPGLNTHEYSALVSPFDSKARVWEAYAQNNTPGAYRVFWAYGPDRKQITIVAITPHP
jgi:hypothetical protein